MERFINQHGVDVGLLTETFVNPGQAFWLVNYVCHRTDRLIAADGTAKLVRRSIVPRSVPVPALTHLEGTAIKVILTGKLVKILPAYLSPSRPLIGADLAACFVGRLPVLLVGDWNAKHVDWNSWLSTRGGNSYVIVPVLSLDRTHQPPTLTTLPILPMSWTS